MKNLKFILSVVALFILCHFTYSQNSYVAFSVNGLTRNRDYSKTEIIKALGEPASIERSEDDGLIYFKYSHNESQSASGSEISVLKIKKDYFGFTLLSNGRYRFEEFTIESSNCIINNKIKIGDHISKIRQLGGSFQDIKDSDGSGRILWCGLPTFELGDESYPRFTYDTQGIIWMIY